MTAHQNRWRSHLLNLLERFLEAAGQAQVVRRKEKALRPAQRKLEKALARAFRKQGAAVVAALTKVSGDFPAEEARRIREAPRDYLPLIDRALDETAEAFIEAIEPAVQAALLAGGEVLLDLIDDLPDNIAFNLKNPRAVAYMRQYGARQVAAINEATRSYLQTILTEATENGWSWQRTAEAITERYQEFAAGVPGPKHIQSRAELIAVTETGNAYEAGNEMAAAHLVDAGLEMEKSWLTVGDGKVSEGCAANQAAGWIPIDQAFPSGAMRPLDHPGCRCTCLFQRKGAGDPS